MTIRYASDRHGQAKAYFGAPPLRHSRGRMTKKAPVPFNKGTGAYKSYYSCGTTQIGAKRPLCRIPSYASGCNGPVTVDAYQRSAAHGCRHSGRPPRTIRIVGTGPRFHLPAALFTWLMTTYSLRFIGFIVFIIICVPCLFCQVNSQTKSQNPYFAETADMV